MSQHRTTTGSGPSQRQLRVGEAIRRSLSEVLARGEVHSDALRAMSITVGEVRVSPDLRIATAYVLPLGGKEKAEALAALNRAQGELRHHVAQAVKLRFAPELRFLIDESYDRMDRTRELLSDARVQRDIAKRDGGDDDGGDRG